MTIVDTTPPSRRRRSSRRRKPAQPRRRQRLLITRRRSSSPLRVPYADGALNFLMQEADIFKVGRRRYLVAPLSAELVDVLIQAAGAGEDAEDYDPAEESGDMEASLGWHTPHALSDQRGLSASGDDLENDGIDDEVLCGAGGGDTALGWANEGSQLHLGLGDAHEREEHLGWSNTGPQLRLVAAGEGDGNCDVEDDDPGGGNVEDEGEPDYEEASPGFPELHTPSSAIPLRRAGA